MKIKNLFTLAVFALLSLTAVKAADTPRAEYPRPQFERSEWVNLNGTWSYEFDFGKSGKTRKLYESTGLSGKITVPFCPESKLSGVEHTDFIEHMWYQRSLEIPASYEGKKIYLNFGAVDYVAEIFIDGVSVDKHYGGSVSFQIDITNYVTPGKTHNLVVAVDDEFRNKMQTAGKQSTTFYSNGCVYTRVTGIWQTVWMEAIAPQGLKRVFAVPDIDQQQLTVRPEFIEESSNMLEVTVLDGNKVVARKSAPCNNASLLVLPIKNPKLWSPEHPYLYDVVYKVKDATGKVIDEVASYAGMRKVSINNGKFCLNNEPYFQRLVLDQGFYPEGVWTAPSDEALKQDIEMSKAVGFNGARLHQKVFEERYLYWADKLGYLTWGETASWGMDVNNEQAVRNFLTEWSEEVVRDRNHPSLVTWTPFNETWDAKAGVYERMMKDVYALTKAIDPTRPVNDSSGDDHIRTDIWSVHAYHGTYKELKEVLTLTEGKEAYRNSHKPFLSKWEGQPYMVDEFGGIGWMSMEERKDSWGYGGLPNTPEEFYERLQGLIDALKELEHVQGFCYTQITDVEQEKNGIYYYDRRPKLDTAKLKAIFESIPWDIRK